MENSQKPDPQASRMSYDQLCASYRAIDDFRTKLLSFLPLVTGGGIVLLTGNAQEVRNEFFPLVGIFGAAITVGLLAYELYGIKKCHELIHHGKAIERDELSLENGQFQTRPKGVLGLIDEPFAAGVIYPAVLAAWIYLAFFYVDRGAGFRFAVIAFFVGMPLILLYAHLLKRMSHQHFR
ncbi:hypothetical protein [Nonomuraea endophytica]|uniref:hypothetical protein n=1 Tax=Nonomuraea endophytica TaxID=714136 RepID=UPI0037C54199